MAERRKEVMDMVAQEVSWASTSEVSCINLVASNFFKWRGPRRADKARK